MKYRWNIGHGPIGLTDQQLVIIATSNPNIFRLVADPTPDVRPKLLQAVWPHRHNFRSLNWDTEKFGRQVYQEGRDYIQVPDEAIYSYYYGCVCGRKLTMRLVSQT